MKELIHHHTDSLQIKNQRQIQQQQKIESLVPYPGQKLWEFNPANGAIAEVQFKSTDADYITEAIRHRVTVNPSCDYVLAINKKNAQKKFIRARVDKHV